MSAVPTAPSATRNTWTCPTCRHGSPDRRDEAAHVDAHRQLGRFLDEWDAAVVSDRKSERRRRPTALAVVGLSVLAVVVATLVLRGAGHTGAPSGRVAGPVPGPMVTVPAPTPAPGSSQVAPGASPEAPASSQAAPVASQPGPAPVTSAPAPVPTAASARIMPVPTAADPRVDGTPAPTVVAPFPVAAAGAASLKSGIGDASVPPTGYLLRLCLVDSCLTVP